jgi:hypothetical protein
MDPYLEAHWHDVHAGLVIYTRDALQGVLPNSLRARVEERVLLETPQGIGNHPLFPDIRVVEYRPELRRGVETKAKSGIAVAEPLIVDVEYDRETETYVEIIDPSNGNRVVTIIEFLSPSNKSPGLNRDQYLHKQQEVCNSATNLVEIDLNRFGTHVLAFPLQFIKPPGHTPYMASVRRATRRGQAEVYRMYLWDRLPVMKIPLRPNDADVPLDLQALVDQCYRNGAYEGTLNYATDPEPSLLGAEKKWAKEHFRKLGLRSAKKPVKRNGKKSSKKK